MVLDETPSYDDPDNARLSGSNESKSENEISHEVVGAALKVHRALGPGLFESVYEVAMKHELLARGLNVVSQQAIPIVYESIRIDAAFRADLTVENKVIVELKSVEELSALHKRQVLTYLRMTGMRLALLINFNVSLIKEGIVRVVNGLREEA